MLRDRRAQRQRSGRFDGGPHGCELYGTEHAALTGYGDPPLLPRKGKARKSEIFAADRKQAQQQPVDDQR